MDWKDELSNLLEARFGALPSDDTLSNIRKIIADDLIPRRWEALHLKEFAIAALPGFVTTHQPTEWVEGAFDAVTQMAFLQALSMLNEYNKYLEKIKNPE